ncbi:hypothetical protein H0H93_014067 [Arthromyces matolae]|nr:hypothetical protein H0H93_014067 [Arthromyces matolae]
MAKSQASEPKTPGPRSLRTRPDPPPQPPIKPRRTSEQVKKDNAAKEKAKNDKNEARNSMIDDVAHMEASLVEENKRLRMEGHHPPPTEQKKIPRSRANLNHNPHSSTTFVPSQDTAMDSNQSFNFAIDPALLENPFGPEPDREEMVLTLSDEENTTSLQGPKNGGNQSIRSQVQASRLVVANRMARHVDEDNSNVASQQDGFLKRKGSASSTDQTIPPVTVKKAKKRNGGLREDWNQTPAASVDPTHCALGITSRTHLSLSNTKSNQDYTGKSSSRPLADQEDSDDEALGGISDDTLGGQVERAKITEDSQPASLGLASQVKSLAAVVKTQSVPEFVPGISAKVIKNRHLAMQGTVKKKAEIRITDLNHHVRLSWDSTFKPRIIDYLGGLTPWQSFTQENTAVVHDIWAACYPHEPRLENDPDLAHVVNKLLDNIITAWQHKFSSTAHTHLTSKIFAELKTTEERRDWAEWSMVRDATEEELKKAPENTRRFYYREYEEPEEPGGEPVSKGIFQSPIIIETLASHYQWVERIDSCDRRQGFPFGALVLTIQACRHHISQWLTGEHVKPPGSLANFSAANWGDRQDREGPSARKNVYLTSDIVDAVQATTQRQQDRIKAAVTDFLQRQARKRSAVTRSVVVPVTAPVKEKIKLRDQDSDSGSEDSESGDDN